MGLFRFRLRGRTAFLEFFRRFFWQALRPQSDKYQKRAFLQTILTA